MKFNRATLVLATSFAIAAVEGAEWSAFFKGDKQEDAAEPKDAVAHEEESNEYVPKVVRRKLERRGRQLASANNNAIPTTSATPTQTFYVPLPEKDVFNDLLKPIAASNACYGDMVSMISVALSTDNTVIWYDHWEDGYDTALVKGAYTEIWGDGNAANGCRPDVPKCTDKDDYLNAGDSFVIETRMNNQRSESGSNAWSNEGIKYDGRDKIQSSYPITITRGEYASTPGSLLAGGVEVHDTTKWGTKFHSPVGSNTVRATEAFEWTRIFLMAKDPNTIVYLPDGTTTNLGEGQSYSFSVKEGDKWSTSAPVQADLCAGDINSNYEMRWFSLLPVELWSDAYFTPVGDSYAFTSLVLYNPQNATIVVTLQYRPEGSKQMTTYATVDYTIPAGKAVFSRYIPTLSAGLVTLKSGPANSKYIVLSFTDTEVKDSTGETLNGQCYDWGFPVVPVNQLTPQVLIGWGYGCTNNKCDGKTARSAVWIAPVANADIYIDYQNTGMNYQKVTLNALESRKIRDTVDTDMSGAIIFATQVNSGPDGPPVDIAAAWGQDPAVSRADQAYSLDLGTVVLPFSTVRVIKVVDKELAKPGETLTYTIKVQNVGQTAIPTGKFTISDPMMGQATYVAGSTKYSDNGGSTFFTIPDNTAAGATPYPLDESGLLSQRDLPRRGGMHLIQFQVVIDPQKVMSSEMVNTGWVTPPFGGPINFKAVTKIAYATSINVENTVYIGDEGEAGCSRATESVQSTIQTSVTYCFKIINTGNTYLDWITLVNDDLHIAPTEFKIPKLGPGDYIVVTKKGKIVADTQNDVTASGWPIFYSGATIPGLNQVSATDPSEVLAIPDNANVTIANTVYKGHDGSATCNVAGVEKVFASPGDPVTYCFTVTNTGNTYLTNIKVTDPIVDNYASDKLVSLAPNASLVVSYAGTMPNLASDADNDLQNIAYVTATPALQSGTVTGSPDVKAQDPSNVGNIVDTGTKSGDKDPYVPPDQPNCMEDAWEDANNNQNLVCRAKEVFLNNIHAKTRSSCKLNEIIKLSVDANIHFNTARYDPGWYVAQDGGDALRGRCAMSGLKVGGSYAVRDGESSTAPVVGSVKWNSDAAGGNDVCGDVTVDAGGGCDIQVPFMDNVDVKCVDQNDDGILDVSVCFSWRVPGTDGPCTLTLEGAQGKLPDMYPGTPSKCFCARYDIPEITVEKPNTDQHISPC